MAGGAGFPFSFKFEGLESNWKNIEIIGGNPGVDTTSRLDWAGEVNDPCMADREPDVNTLTIVLTEPAPASNDVRGDITWNGFGFVEGLRAVDINWEASYDGVVFASGEGLYCTECSFSGSIPGEGRTVIRFQTVGLYWRN